MQTTRPSNPQRTEIQRYFRQYDLDGCLGVSLTLKQFALGVKLDEIRASKNLRHFLNFLNTEVYGKRFKRFTELKTMQDEAKKEFLEGVVGRINATSLGKNRYECAVHFRLPYVEDRLVKATGIGAKKTSRFTVEDGRDTTTVPLVFAPVKRRRRKQS